MSCGGRRGQKRVVERGRNQVKAHDNFALTAPNCRVRLFESGECMVRLVLFLVALGFLSGAIVGCHASGTVDPHSSSFVTSPR